MYCWPLPSLRDDHTLMSPWRTCFDLARTNTHTISQARPHSVVPIYPTPAAPAAMLQEKKNTRKKREKNTQEGHCGSAAARAPALLLRLSVVLEGVSCFSFDRVCLCVCECFFTCTIAGHHGAQPALYRVSVLHY